MNFATEVELSSPGNSGIKASRGAPIISWHAAIAVATHHDITASDRIQRHAAHCTKCLCQPVQKRVAARRRLAGSVRLGCLIRRLLRIRLLGLIGLLPISASLTSRISCISRIAVARLLITAARLICDLIAAGRGCVQPQFDRIHKGMNLIWNG